VCVGAGGGGAQTGLCCNQAPRRGVQSVGACKNNPMVACHGLACNICDTLLSVRYTDHKAQTAVGSDNPC